MNILKGTISSVATAGKVTLVDVAVHGRQMSAVMIGSPGKVGRLESDQAIELIFNESEVSLGRIKEGEISLSNGLPCRVESIVTGTILSQVRLSFQGDPLSALITTRSARRLDLKPGDPITAFVKATEVLLRKPCEEGDAD